MNYDEIRKLIFTRVIGKTIGLDYKGELIGYDSSERNSYVIRLDSSNRLVNCYDVDPIQTPKLRPYKNSSEIPLDKIMGRYKCWPKGSRASVVILGDSVTLGSLEATDFITALEKWEWADGSPFGILDE